MQTEYYIQRIREALSHPHLAEMGDWYSPEDDRNPLCDAALIAACSPEAMRAILGALDGLQAEAAENKVRWRSLAQPLCASIGLDAWAGPSKILAEVLDALAERDKLAAELAKTRAYYATSQIHAADLGEALRVATEQREPLAESSDNATAGDCGHYRCYGSCRYRAGITEGAKP